MKRAISARSRSASRRRPQRCLPGCAGHAGILAARGRPLGCAPSSPCCERSPTSTRAPTARCRARAVRRGRAELEREAADGRTTAHFERRSELNAQLRAAYARALGAEPSRRRADDLHERRHGAVDRRPGAAARAMRSSPATRSTRACSARSAPRASCAASRSAKCRSREIAEAVGPRTRLVACSHVGWMSGCSRPPSSPSVDVPVLLDGAQGVGAVPVDVRRARLRRLRRRRAEVAVRPRRPRHAVRQPARCASAWRSRAAATATWPTPTPGSTRGLHEDARRFDALSLSAEARRLRAGRDRAARVGRLDARARARALARAARWPSCCAERGRERRAARRTRRLCRSPATTPRRARAAGRARVHRAQHSRPALAAGVGRGMERRERPRSAAAALDMTLAACSALAARPPTHKRRSSRAAASARRTAARAARRRAATARARVARLGLRHARARAPCSRSSARPEHCTASPRTATRNIFYSAGVQVDAALAAQLRLRLVRPRRAGHGRQAAARRCGCRRPARSCSASRRSACCCPRRSSGVLAVALLYRVIARRLGGSAGARRRARARGVPVVRRGLARQRRRPAADPADDARLRRRRCARPKAGAGARCSGAALLVGLAFNTKTLAAYLVVPGIALAYLVCAPGSLRRRVAAAARGGLAMLVVSFAWIAFVELTPASKRPYVGSSTNNTELGLTFELQRLRARRRPGRRPGPRSPSASRRACARSALAPRRAGQAQPTSTHTVAPAAPEHDAAAAPNGRARRGEPPTRSPSAARRAACGCSARASATRAAGCCRSRWSGARVALLRCSLGAAPASAGSRAGRDPRLAALLVLGGWFVVEAAVLSLSKGIVHPYYVSALGPGAAAMVGAGAVAFGELARGGATGALLLAALRRRSDGRRAARAAAPRATTCPGSCRC